jgi:hypothetical protein
MTTSSEKKNKGRSKAKTGGKLSSGTAATIALGGLSKKMKLSEEQKEMLLKSVYIFGAHLTAHGQASTIWATTFDAWFGEECMQVHRGTHYVPAPIRANHTSDRGYDDAVSLHKIFVRKCRRHYEAVMKEARCLSKGCIVAREGSRKGIFDQAEKIDNEIDDI